MSATIRVVVNRLPALAGQVDTTLETALDAGVAAAIATADPLTPVDTGALRANKSIEREAGGRRVIWNQEYAAFNEFGTYRMGARPFAKPGADAAAPVIDAELGRFGR